MNKRIISTAILGYFLLTGLVFTIGCAKPEPKAEIPRYTADQVIAVARRQYPISFKGKTLVSAPNEISVLYIGGTSRAWHVSVRAPEGYQWTERSFDEQTYYTYTEKIVYFWETDGSLHYSRQ